MPALEVHCERWPIEGIFRIARGAKTEAEVIVVEIAEGSFRGRGEGVPYARFGESMDSALAALKSVERYFNKPELSGYSSQEFHLSGAARNALDCAMIDFDAKRSGRPAYEILGLPAPRPRLTAYTISLDTPEAMATAAARARDRPLLKLKLGPESALTCLEAVRRAAPDSAIIVDANEAWSLAALESLAPRLPALGVVLIEQPLPAGADEALTDFDCGIPLCADESILTRAELAAVTARYDAINIKLDKAGGLTEALALQRTARAAGLGIMVGCMVATSLAMAPAFLLAQDADFVDLDGPLLLARDRPVAIRYEGSLMHPPPAALWG